MFINKRHAENSSLRTITKNVSQPKGFNKNTDRSNTEPPMAKISCHLPKVKSNSFEDPYGQINPTDNTNDVTYLIDANEEHNIKYY